jgi:site-specific DNA-methyltransferase (adenine-specific)
MNDLICGNNIDVLKTFPDEYIDLTVTSPPYDKLRQYNGFSFDFEGLAEQLYRVTKKGGVVVWVVGDSVENRNESGTSFKQALYFKDCGFKLHDTMIYQKNGSSIPSPKITKTYFQSFEYMFVFSKGDIKTWNLICDSKNKTSGSKYKSHGRTGDGESVKYFNVGIVPEYSIRGNIWFYDNRIGVTTSDKIAYKHPAIFSEKLAEDHIISWSNKGDVVLDPFVGSGTTCKMAKQLGRNYIGIDISQEYINISKERLK